MPRSKYVAYISTSTAVKNKAVLSAVRRLNKSAVEVVAYVGKNKAALSAVRRLNVAVLALHKQEEVARLLDALEREEKARDRDLPAGRKRRNRIGRQLMANEAFFRVVQEWDRVFALTPLRPTSLPPDWIEYRSEEEQKVLQEKVGRIKGTASFVARKQREREEIGRLYLEKLAEHKRKSLAIREVLKERPKFSRAFAYKVARIYIPSP